jgi:acyl-CoA thioesterase YciA
MTETAPNPPSASEPTSSNPAWPSDEPIIRTIAMPADTNPEGDIFGGWLLSQMDLAAATVAFRLAQGRCATVAIDGMSFISPVFVGDEVSLFARVVATGRSSVKVFVEAWRRRRDSLDAVKVTQGTFTFVAIGPDRKSRPLPTAV